MVKLITDYYIYINVEDTTLIEFKKDRIEITTKSDKYIFKYYRAKEGVDLRKGASIDYAKFLKNDKRVFNVLAYCNMREED